MIGSCRSYWQTICNELSKRHDIITVGRSGGTFKTDTAGPANLDALFKETGRPAERIVCITGNVVFAQLTALKKADFEVGLKNKLTGVN